jgi:hypothetical protein
VDHPPSVTWRSPLGVCDPPNGKRRLAFRAESGRWNLRIAGTFCISPPSRDTFGYCQLRPTCYHRLVMENGTAPEVRRS